MISLHLSLGRDHMVYPCYFTTRRFLQPTSCTIPNTIPFKQGYLIIKIYCPGRSSIHPDRVRPFIDCVQSTAPVGCAPYIFRVAVSQHGVLINAPLFPLKNHLLAVWSFRSGSNYPVIWYFITFARVVGRISGRGSRGEGEGTQSRFSYLAGKQSITNKNDVTPYS
jgi:hypothetical protein